MQHRLLDKLEPILDRPTIRQDPPRVIERIRPRVKKATDAIVVARISGEKSPRADNILADAVAETTRLFPPSGESHRMTSQAPVPVMQDFDHYVVAIHYPDTSISRRSESKILKNLRKRMDGVEDVRIFRI